MIVKKVGEGGHKVSRGDESLTLGRLPGGPMVFIRYMFSLELVESVGTKKGS